MKYRVVIDFLSNDDTVLYEGDFPYYSKKKYTDHVVIKKSSIEISGQRNANVELDEITNIYKSTLYDQVIKSLLYYFVILEEIYSIQEIRIYKNEEEHIVPNNEINFFSKVQISDVKYLDRVKLRVIFDSEHKSKLILRSLFYWFEAVSSGNEITRFERFWRAFNILYVYCGKSKKDFYGLINIRKYIIDNQSDFENTMKKVQHISTSDLRMKFRWRNLILNDYETIEKTQGYHDFVLRYTDKRVMKLFRELGLYRNKFLKQKGLFRNVENHISDMLTEQNDKKIELVALIIVKYSYFLRNKYFHGEYNENFYNLFQKTKNDDEFILVNEVIRIFLIELINSMI